MAAPSRSSLTTAAMTRSSMALHPTYAHPRCDVDLNVASADLHTLDPCGCAGRQLPYLKYDTWGCERKPAALPVIHMESTETKVCPALRR